MAVVINEFETTAVPPPAAPAAARGDQQSAGGQGKNDPVKEIEKKLHKHAERSRRLWAY